MPYVVSFPFAAHKAVNNTAVVNRKSLRSGTCFDILKDIAFAIRTPTFCGSKLINWPRLGMVDHVVVDISSFQIILDKRWALSKLGN